MGFVTLPDLFYSIHPKTTNDVEREVEQLKDSFNRKVREVLARKLKQYLIWKEKTYKELKTGQTFKLKYLRQHFHVIKVYLNWLRPYLRNIKVLQMKGSVGDEDIISAFDTSKIELEILAVKKKYEVETSPGNKEMFPFQHYFPCVRVRWNFVAIPQLAYQEDFQRGAIHRGRTTLTIEGFVVTSEEMDAYKKKVDHEDFELLAAVDESILAMKEEIDKYLSMAGEVQKKEEETHRQSVLSLFTSVARGFREMLGVREKKGKGMRRGLMGQERSAAQALAGFDAYLCYKIFKQSHGMITE